MADPRKRIPDTAPGRFYVTEDCTHCGGCIVIAPGLFAGGDPEWKTPARLVRQPATAEETEACLNALAACPCDAIGDEAARIA